MPVGATCQLGPWEAQAPGLWKGDHTGPLVRRDQTEAGRQPRQAPDTWLKLITATWVFSILNWLKDPLLLEGSGLQTPLTGSVAPSGKFCGMLEGPQG